VNAIAGKAGSSRHQVPVTQLYDSQPKRSLFATQSILISLPCPLILPRSVSLLASLWNCLAENKDLPFLISISVGHHIIAVVLDSVFHYTLEPSSQRHVAVASFIDSLLDMELNTANRIPGSLLSLLLAVAFDSM
jgi:hypothetical protein